MQDLIMQIKQESTPKINHGNQIGISRRSPMDIEAEITYLVVLDYLEQMAEALLLTPVELDHAKRMAAEQYGIKNVSV